MIGRPSSPRPEIDVLAYRPRENLSLIIEDKSYLDSPGVAFEHIDTEFVRGEGYRLFKDEGYRRVMFRRLKSELVNEGAIHGTVSTIPGMVAGKVKGDEEVLEQFFSQRGWFLEAQSIGGKTCPYRRHGIYRQSLRLHSKTLDPKRLLI